MNQEMVVLRYRYGSRAINYTNCACALAFFGYRGKASRDAVIFLSTARTVWSMVVGVTVLVSMYVRYCALAYCDGDHFFLLLHLLPYRM